MSLDDTSVSVHDTAGLIVFGLDDNQRPHASSFLRSEAQLAEKAAGLMGMRVMPVATEAELAIAAKLPRGKVFASGRGFVPFVKAGLFDEIVAAAPPAPEPSATKLNDDDLQAGASDKPAIEPAPKAKKAAKAKTDLAPRVVPTPAQPDNWEAIEVGCVVLATAPPQHLTWYECEVIAVDGDELTLQFLDWPEEPTFVRAVADVGLMHPTRPVDPIEPEQVATA